MRRRHRDDLATVGRIGERLLVAGHAGVEDHLAERLAFGTEALAVQRRAVFQDQERLHRVSFPSSTVGVPRRNVATTRPGTIIPANGVLRLFDAPDALTGPGCAAGSYRVRLAGLPTATGAPWPASRPIRAGRTDIRSATPVQSSSPVLTMASCTTRSAVSSPVIPQAASAHSVSLASTGCGAWSVATQSMVPSASASRSARTSAAVRNGGFTLYTGSYPTARSSVSSRWCGVTSAVTGHPLALAHLMISTDPAVDTWQTCS